MLNSDLEVLQTAIAWLRDGSEVELVTLANCWGSAPRPPGSLAVVRDDGAVIGSVSGGCIEKELSTLLREKNGAGILQHQVSHEQAKRFGLACGGSLDLVFERHFESAELDAIVAALISRQSITRTIDLECSETTLRPAKSDDEFLFDGNRLTKVFGPTWRLLLVGAGQLSRFVADMALALDYDVVVCEPREHFFKAWSLANVPIDNRLPDDAVNVYARDNRSGVLALSHEPNLDDLAILEALESDVFYLGALGSKKSSESRRKRLLDLGAEEKSLARLYAPIGLSIGSRSAAEIAISILAEVTAVRNGATGAYSGGHREIN